MIGFLAILALAAGVQTAAGASIDLEARNPVMGEPISLTVIPDDSAAAGWTVTANYFPNSVVEEAEEIGMTDSAGRVEWTPQHAGIVSLNAARGDDTAKRAVGVAFSSLPGGAVLVFIIAGTILLGGAGWSLIRLMEHDPAHGLH